MVHLTPSDRAAMRHGRAKRAGRVVTSEALVAERVRRQLARGDVSGAAASMLRQDAAADRSPARRSQLLKAATLAEAASRHQRGQLRFDFGGDNMSISREYLVYVTKTLRECGHPRARLAMDVWHQCCIRLDDFGSHVVQGTAAEIARDLGQRPAEVSQALGLLERLQILSRKRSGRSKVITLTPEGVYFGNHAEHSAAVRRYAAEHGLTLLDGGAPPAPAVP